MSDLEALLERVRACRVCALPHEPRPVLRVAAAARLLIVGQAPGNRVHQTGIPWNDPSGDRLRAWLQIDRDRFYGRPEIGIMPMGFCFPGTDPRGADFPPRPECAPLWHPPVLEELRSVRLTLLVGQYAQKRYLPEAKRLSLTETVRKWRDWGPDRIALPHPSWRNTAWIKKNPWFETEVLPMLRARVAEVLAD